MYFGHLVFHKFYRFRIVEIATDQNYFITTFFNTERNHFYRQRDINTLFTDIFLFIRIYLDNSCFYYFNISIVQANLIVVVFNLTKPFPF